MPIIFTLRLLPNPPTDAQNFLRYLSGLQIRAFDRSVADPSEDVEIGNASGPAASPFENLQISANPSALTPSIVVHPDPRNPIQTTAVATAIIVVKDDAATSQRPEFPDAPARDVRLEITRGNTKIQREIIDFNISGKNVQELSNNPVDYMGLSISNPSNPDFVNLPTGAYLFIPGPLASDTADPGPVITLDPKGAPPEFGELVRGIDAVLAKDHPPPTTATSLAALAEPLTIPQAAEIAAELIWNRKVFPLPTPRIPLEDLYTGTPTDNEQERVRFEGALTAYYATHNADAERLKRFVYAASAAVLAEKQSFRATQATLTFPIDPSMSTATSASTIPITLTGPPGTAPPPALKPSLAVPAAYFYALGISFSVNQKPEKLYERALTATAEFLTSSLGTAIDSGAIEKDPQETISNEVAPQITANLAQAIRRLTALSGSFSTKPKYKAILPANPGNSSGDVAALVTRWLDQTVPDVQLISAFWPNEYGGNDYLEVVLQVISDGRLDLENAIRTFPGVTIDRASDLIRITDQQWISFFATSPALLPDFTKPGNTDDRARAYIQFLRTLFSISFLPVPPIAPIAGTIPGFGDYEVDMLWRFISAISGSFNLDNFPNDAAIDSALTTAFPDDERAQAWARQAINTLHDLYRMTKPLATAPADQFQFSCMEALFARGLSSVKAVLAISSEQLRIALQGTVAWASAETIYDAAGELGQFLPNEDEPDVGFKPINPGNLVDCIPPDHLSPLGPVEYLHEALQNRSGDITLQDAIKDRRGNIGQLLVTKHNLQIELPQIDLVNESLEFLGSNLTTPHGVLQDTKNSQGSPDQDREEILEQALVATPEWSTPAVPIANPKIYDDLKSTFTDPVLPYTQHLDVARSYLKMLGSDRFETMRRFRRDITELAMDPSHEPPDFQRHLWRYPLHYDIALEYIGLSREEDEILFTGKLKQSQIADLYGYVDAASFIDEISLLPNFLKSTGLEYCEFYELWETQFEPLKIEKPFSQLPPCPPCCGDNIILSTPSDESEESAPPWGRVMIFIRLWRRLQRLCQKTISFQILSDICHVLRLFDPNTHATNPDFIRQLVSLLVLHNNLSLPWTDDQDETAGNKNEKRTKLLALWVGPQKAPAEWEWAVTTLLSHIQVHAEARYRCPRRPPEFVKILSDNLDSLSRLAGFMDDFPWYLNPSCTLRFAEVLTKIFASEFTVGEIIFLFTSQDHLRGDDPYPFTEESEAHDDPLNAPEDDEHGLWELRKKLLCTSVADCDAERWTWSRIQAACVALGFKPSSTLPDGDALVNLGAHFFPSTLESSGHWIDASSRRFSIPLAPNLTSPDLWSGEHCKAFHYARNVADPNSGELWTQLPLDDQTVFQQLIKSRQLNGSEARAVRDVYFAPRAVLAPFAQIFENFGQAVEQLIHEPCEDARFCFFRKQFALFYRRCEVIASHLAEQIDALPGWTTCVAKDCGCGCLGKAPNVKAAWQILRTLIADENQALSPWEDDTGKPPENFLVSRFSGNGFTALLGLTGTGLLGKIETGFAQNWPELRGEMDAFGCVRNHWNSPVPTYIPSLQLFPLPQQRDLVAIRNGFALEDDHANALGGAQPFNATWTGSLLVEETGEYTFSAGHPENCCEFPAAQLEEGQKWLVTLQRGQKTWTILNRCWKDVAHAPAHHSKPLNLTKGVYAIVIKFKQNEPKFTKELSVHQFHTGFQVQYCGPDTSHVHQVLPHHRLFQDSKENLLDTGLDIGGSIGLWLNGQYFSTFRDIRRTYQRAFKAILFARRFHLSAHEEHHNGQSELCYILDHDDRFLGTAYYPDSPNTWKTHHAFLDFNFLPVTDSYFPPDISLDSRVNPSPKRKAALFDWWERLFDYTNLRGLIERIHRHRNKRRRKGIWQLFYEADTHKPDDAHQLIRHFDAELSLATQVLTFFVSPDQLFEVRAPELLDERWSIRVAKAVSWLADVKSGFYAKEYEILAPALAASDDPGLEIDGESGNSTLTRFTVKAGEEEPSRMEAVRCVNDALRERGRLALLAYLCGMNRVTMGFASQDVDEPVFAVTPQDLSALLLQDVEVGILQRASRIEDAIQAVQTFVQRARIGLEPKFPVTREFSESWECKFSSFKTWQAQKRRALYRESWIHWDDLRRLEKSEGFNFFRNEVKKDVDTLANTARRMWWPNLESPDAPGIQGVTAEQNAVLGRQRDAMEEGLSIMATPDRHGRPTLVAPQKLAETLPPGGSEDPDNPGPDDPVIPLFKLGKPTNLDADGKTATQETSLIGIKQAAASLFDEVSSPPLWLQSAIRMGTRFVRVAASGVPPGFPYATTPADPERPREVPCCKCHQSHPPNIDEYYFWLSDSSFYSEKDAIQKANNDISISDTTDPTSDWDDPEKLPLLLHWVEQPIVHLFWTRLHRGVLDPPQRSDEGIELRSDDGEPGNALDVELTFTGRNVDSLFFTAAGKGTFGFRYDLPTDSAVVTPQTVPDNPPAPHPLNQSLSAYPYFLYFSGGVSLEPMDSRCVALEMSRRLKEDCKFEAASLWCRKAFDALNRDNSWMRCPKASLASLKEGGNHRSSSSENVLTPPSSSANVVGDPIALAQVSRREDVTCCRTTPMGDGVSRARAALLEYLDILRQWVDNLIRHNSMESFRKALVVVDSMQRLLGPTPMRIEAQRNESAFLYVVENFRALPAPLNSRLLQLYDEVTDRKAVIRDFLGSCRLRNGKLKQDLALWGSSTRFSKEETFLVQTQDELCDDAMQCCLARCQPYRFNALMPKALEWAAMVRGLGSSLLTAFEKGDSEYLSALRTSHEHHILNLGIEVAQNNFRAADWDYQALGKTLAGAQTRARYYKDLIEGDIIALERGYERGMESALQNRIEGNIEEVIGQGVNMIPDFYVGFPAALNHLPLGTKLSYFFSVAARMQNTIADNNSTNASLSETQAGWLRRAEEWQHQLNVTEIEIEQIKRQQLAAARRRHVALTELNNHQRQLEHSQEVTDFLRDRFTKHELYNFLQQETSVLYKQAFRLALQSANDAQTALWYELGTFYSCHSNSQLEFEFSENVLWNSLHEGLLAGEKLELGLRALERKYMTSMCREYELTKHISLRQMAPFAFLQLKTGEECELEIPEWWFDLDYPGQYMRRLKQVSLSLPCVTGPFTGVHCRLQLLSSKVRVRPLLPPPPECCCATPRPAIETPGPSPSRFNDNTTQSLAIQDPRPAPKNRKAECVKCSCGPNAKRLPEDPYVLHAHHTTSSHMAIATSTGTADPGIFDASLEGARYLPFEFAGAASRWRISLPTQTNTFSLDSLSDVVMHVTYTSREGGTELRRAAEGAVCGRSVGDGVRFVDVKGDMGEAYRDAFGPGSWGDHGYGSECEEDGESKKTELKLAFKKNMFPYTHGARYRDVWIKRVHVFMEVMEDTHYPACSCSSNPCECQPSGLERGNHFGVIYQPPSLAVSSGCSHHGNADHHHRSSNTPRSPMSFTHKKPSNANSQATNIKQGHAERKTSHFNDVESSSSSSSSSSESESECNCYDDSDDNDHIAGHGAARHGDSKDKWKGHRERGDCKPDLRVKFTMVSSPPPCHPDNIAAVCVPTTYYGIFNPVRPLGPVTDDRDRNWGARSRGESHCSQGQELGSLVFSPELWESADREVEAVYLLVEYEYGDCRVRGNRRTWGNAGGNGMEKGCGSYGGRHGHGRDDDGGWRKDSRRWGKKHERCCGDGRR